MTRTLITGGAGFIGLHLAQNLLERGHAVTLLDNFARGKEDRDLEQFARHENVVLVKGDLRDSDTVEKLGRDLDYVVHLAAVVGVRNVMNTPFKVLVDNVSLTEAAIDLAKHQEKFRKFIFASTSEVVAETLESVGVQIPTPETAPLTIIDPSRPRTTYSLSKIYGEALCHHSGIPFVSVRPHNVYGPRMGMAHVIPELLKKAYQAEEGGRIEIASPSHTRTFCYVSDAVEIIARLMEQPDADKLVANLGKESPEIGIMELAELVVNTTGKNIQLDEGAEHPGSPSRRCPDMTKTSALIGFEAQVPLEEGVEETFSWYRQNIFDKET